MLFGMDQEELEAFAKRLAGTAIVNQAAVKCLGYGLPLTEENVVLFVGDFFEPTRPGAQELVSSVMKAIDEVTIKPPSRPTPN